MYIKNRYFLLFYNKFVTLFTYFHLLTLTDIDIFFKFGLELVYEILCCWGSSTYNVLNRRQMFLCYSRMRCQEQQQGRHNEQDCWLEHIKDFLYGLLKCFPRNSFTGIEYGQIYMHSSSLRLLNKLWWGEFCAR